jgi:hypothetical protein
VISQPNPRAGPFSPDPIPLEKPVPLKTLKSGDAAKICDAIAKAVADNGFNVANQDCDVGVFEATKKITRARELQSTDHPSK